MRVVQGAFSGESSDTNTLSRNYIATQLLIDCMGYNRKRIDEPCLGKKPC